MRKHPSEQSRLCNRDAILTNGYPSSGADAPPSPKGEGLDTAGGRRRRARCVRLLGFPVGEAVASATDEGLRKAKHLTMLCRLP